MLARDVMQIYGTPCKTCTRPAPLRHSSLTPRVVHLCARMHMCEINVESEPESSEMSAKEVRRAKRCDQHRADRHRQRASTDEEYAAERLRL